MHKNMSFEEKANFLKAEYEKMLPKKVGKIQEHFQKLQTMPEQLQELSLIRHLAHGMAGSGASFGYTELSRQAKLLEDTIDNFFSDAPSSAKGKLSQIEEHLAGLRMAMHIDDGGFFADAAHSEPVEASGPVIFWWGGSEQNPPPHSQLHLFDLQVVVIDDLQELQLDILNHNPAALILDLTQPNSEHKAMGHVELIESACRAVPTIALLAEGHTTDRQLSSFRWGCADCISVPFADFQLVDRINQVLEEARERPYHILLVDDDNILTTHFNKIMTKAGLRIRTVNQPRQSLEVLENFHPDLIFLDLYMPDIDGIELARLLQLRPDCQGVPIVFLSSEQEAARQLDAFRVGAEDFIVKPLSYRFLYHSLLARMKRGRALRSLLKRDPLTGLLNQKTMRLRLEETLAIAKRHNGNLALIRFLLPTLAQVNREHGHDAAERLLQTTAMYLQRQTAQQGLLGRFGGNFFGVILPGKDFQQAQVLIASATAGFAGLHHDTHTDRPFRAPLEGKVAVFPEQADIQALIDAVNPLPPMASSIDPSAPSAPEEKQHALDTSELHAPSDQDEFIDWDSDEITFIEEDEEEDFVAKLKETVANRETNSSETVTPEPSKKPIKVKTDTDNPKVLVVDDEKNVVRLIEAFFEDHSYQVITASKSDQALLLAREHKPALVITDLLLFPGHGFELCKAIRQEEQLRNTKIMVMTAVYKRYRYRLEAREAGADDFIEKPLDFEILLQKVERLLSNDSSLEKLQRPD